MEKNEVKAWLSAIGKKRAWLVSQLGVSVHTVNGWLYGKANIPARTVLLIQALMREFPAGGNAKCFNAVRSISAPCTQEEKEAIQKAASVVHEGEEAFVLNASLTRARNVLSSHGKE